MGSVFKITKNTQKNTYIAKNQPKEYFSVQSND